MTADGLPQSFLIWNGTPVCMSAKDQQWPRLRDIGIINI